MNFCWSYSSLSLFTQCARKFHRLRILKDIVEPESRHLIYGKEVHKAAEEYGRDNKEIPEEYKFIQPHVDILLDTNGDKFFEYSNKVWKEYKEIESTHPGDYVDITRLASYILTVMNMYFEKIGAQNRKIRINKQISVLAIMN